MQATTEDLDSLQVEFNDDIIDSCIIEQIADKFVSEASAEQIFFAFNNITKLMSLYDTENDTERKEPPSVLNKIKTKTILRIIAEPNKIDAVLTASASDNYNKQQLIDTIAQQLIAEPSKINAVLTKLDNNPDNKQKLIYNIAEQLIAELNKIDAVLTTLDSNTDNKQKLINIMAQQLIAEPSMINAVLTALGSNADNKQKAINKELMKAIEVAKSRALEGADDVAQHYLTANDLDIKLINFPITCDNPGDARVLTALLTRVSSSVARDEHANFHKNIKLIKTQLSNLQKSISPDNPQYGLINSLVTAIDSKLPASEPTYQSQSTASLVNPATLFKKATIEDCQTDTATKKETKNVQLTWC